MSLIPSQCPVVQGWAVATAGSGVVWSGLALATPMGSVQELYLPGSQAAQCPESIAGSWMLSPGPPDVWTTHRKISSPLISHWPEGCVGFESSRQDLMQQVTLRMKN